MVIVSSARAHAAGTSAAAAEPASASASISTQGRRNVDARSPMEVKTADTPEAKPGSQPVLMSEVRYGIVFGEMNEVFNHRVNSLLFFMLTLCGLLSAGGFITNLKGVLPGEAVFVWSVVLGAVTAVTQAARLAFKFKERAAEFRAAKKAFQELEGRGWSMNQGTLTKEIARLRANAPSGGDWLASAAFNKACAELGYPDRKRRMPAHIRFIAARVG